VKLRQVRLASVPGLPDRIRKALVEYGLDREFGRADSWTASVEKKYTEVDGWAVKELILNYWRISLRYLHVPGEAISRFLNGLKEGTHNRDTVRRLRAGANTPTSVLRMVFQTG
jgi:hypothetical protein